MESHPSTREHVSVVIPAYNEEDCIVAQVESIKSVMDNTNHNYEIIVVDDGSTDSTAKKVETLDVNLVSFANNRGYGAALKAGIDKSRSELIVITDADGTYPSEAIPEMLDLAYKYDMIVGSREGKKVNMQLKRKPAKWLLRILASYLAGIHIPDLNSGLRVLKKTYVKRFFYVLPSGFSFTTTITLAFLCNEFQVYYHPINYFKRTGTSKIRPIHAYYFLLLIIRTIVYFNPLKVFLPLGGILFVAGIGKFIYDVTLNNLSESAVMGILSAIIIWALGLLADQNSRNQLIERIKQD